jgi:nucleoside-diphosphate-sugar epimerase
MRVCVTGGCGYIGSALVPKLLEEGHSVRVVDAMWFGNRLEPHAELETIEYDLRGGDPPVEGCAAVIHLAAIANDPCGDLDARLTWEVNALATVRLAQKCAKLGIRQMIFASSASIYGIKDNRPVTEDEPFEPVSDYNKTKLVGERALLSFSRDMNVQIVRPATVCGFSPRMRLDVIVNMLTAQAIEKGRITAHCGAHGGNLMRPHAHIDDLTDLYVWLLDRPYLKGPFNAGFENLSVGDLAEAIRGETGADVEFTEVADKRSYAVDSSSLRRAGFVPRSSVNDAIREMALGWRAGKIKREPTSINLEWMRAQGIAR